MHWLDIIVLILWGLMVVWGARAGITGIAIKLLAVVAAALAGSWLGPKIGGMIIPSDALGSVPGFVGYFLVSVAVFIVFAAAGGWISRALGFVPLIGSLNRLGGAAVGLLIGILLSIGVLLGLKQLEYETTDEAMSDAPIAGFVVDNLGFAAQAARLVPQDWEVELKDRTGLERDPYIVVSGEWLVVSI